jgi:hypothetical protein
MLPTLGNTHPKGYFDSGMKLRGVDPHGYVSVQAVEDMASHLGFLSPAENEHMCSQLAEAHEQIDSLIADLEEANAELDAINIIRSKGWKPQKKTGRKPKKQEHDPELIA